MSHIDMTTANDEPCAGCGHPLGNERLGIIGVPGTYHAHCLPHASTAALLATARADGRREGLEMAAPVIAELAGVVWQMLDDMGAHGGHICEAAKASARAALDRVAAPSLEIDYTMAQAEACFKEIGGEPQVALCAEEIAEPWATAIRAMMEKE